MGNRVVHFDIGCKDLDASRDFYTQVFDWESQPYGPASAKLTPDPDSAMAGFTTSLGHEPHQYVMLYIEVDSISDYLATVQQHGGEVLIPATPVPDGGEFAWCKDPSGNLFGLWCPPE